MTDPLSSGGTFGSGPAPDAEFLLGENYEAFDDVLAGRSPGPLAVVGAPFSGREGVLDAAAERLDGERRRLEPDGGDEVRPPDPGDRPVVVGDCQHLYERTIGGFDALDRFLDRVATVDVPVVTGWNRHAWAYLVATRGIDREFAVRAELQPLGAEDLADLLLDGSGDPPEFVRDEPEDGGFVEVRRRPIGRRDRGWSVPYPVPNLAAITGRRRDGDLDPRDVVFQRLAAVSNGNAGVAAAIWDQYEGAEIRPSDVVAAGGERSLTRDEEFCLRVVLAKESVERAELAGILGDGLDRILKRLARDGFLGPAAGRVDLRPAAVPTAVELTERRRML